MQLPELTRPDAAVPPEWALTCAPRLVAGETRQGLLRGRWVSSSAEPKTISQDMAKVALRDFIRLVDSTVLHALANGYLSEISRTVSHLATRLTTAE